jgi:hypothetical protein
LSNIKSTTNELGLGIKDLLDQLPGDCSFEDNQYHLHAVEKIQPGIKRAVAEEEGSLSQQEIEKQLKKWISQ